jgi:hypothetical protein
MRLRVLQLQKCFILHSSMISCSAHQDGKGLLLVLCIILHNILNIILHIPQLLLNILLHLHILLLILHILLLLHNNLHLLLNILILFHKRKSKRLQRRVLKMNSILVGRKLRLSRRKLLEMYGDLCERSRSRQITIYKTTAATTYNKYRCRG